MADPVFPTLLPPPGVTPLTLAAPTHLDQDALVPVVTMPHPTPAGPSGTATYAWTFLERPTGSAASFSDATAAQPTVASDLAGSYVASCLVTLAGQTARYEHSWTIGRDGWVLRGEFDLTAQGDHDFLATPTKVITDTLGRTATLTYTLFSGVAPSVLALSAAGLTCSNVKNDAADLRLYFASTGISGWTPTAGEEVHLSVRMGAITNTRWWTHAGLDMAMATPYSLVYSYGHPGSAGWNSHIGRLRNGIWASTWRTTPAVQPECMGLSLAPRTSGLRVMYRAAGTIPAPNSADWTDLLWYDLEALDHDAGTIPVPSHWASNAMTRVGMSVSYGASVAVCSWVFLELEVWSRKGAAE